jgi:hypothetical protein
MIKLKNFQRKSFWSLRFEIWNLFGICSLGFEIDHFGRERTISPIGKNMVK